MQFLMMTFAGSFVQELVHWYDLRGKLNAERYQALMQSTLYKVLVVGMLVMPPLTSWLLFSQKLGGDRMEELQSIVGAAGPLVIRKLVSGLTKNLHVRFSETFAVLSDYLN